MRAVITALTSEQEQAVARRQEPLLLAAGAGSGKTSVLVERFVRAVREDQIAPGRILAITFTERAAGELRERVSERLMELGEREAARDTEAAFVSTFHGFCARLLRAHPLMAGLDPEFAILDEGLAGRLRERAFRAALRDFLDGGAESGHRGEAVDLLAAYGADRVRSMVEGVYAELRSRGRGRPRLPKPAPEVGPDTADVDAAGAAACVLLDELLDGFGRSYEAFKRERGAVDFDDLELCARELLEQHESVRAAWSERFELLMVDEFQDTNPRQLAILKALERGNLFTVGDELQSIYGFRHADVSLFRDRRAQLAERGGTLALAGNFRSPAALLEVVNAVFEKRFGAGYTPLIAAEVNGSASEDAPRNGRHEGSEPLVELLLTSRRGWDDDGAPADGIACDGPSGRTRLASAPPAGRLLVGRSPAASRWRQAEARMLAQRVAELVESGEARAGEVVVLLRAVGDLEMYERALQQQGLRTLAAVGGFWGHQQVGDLLAYLLTLANPLDEPALYATLASPLVGCSSDGLALIARAAQARGTGQVWETIQRGGEELDARLPVGDRDALIEFRDRLQAERETASRRTISKLIERAIDASGYREHVLGLEWGERRLANVHKLLRLARRFEASEGRDLRGFLDYVAHLKDTANGAEPDAQVAGAEPDAVRLMSIHAAKGLEFPVVCVADLGRAQNLSVPDLLVDGDRVGLRLVRLDGAEATPSLDFESLCEERKRAQAEEEERILYVAMTRARERLLLSGAVDFERWPEQREGAPTISWLGPALAPDLPAIVLGDLRSAERPVCDLAVGTSGGARVRLRLKTPSSGAAEQLGVAAEGAAAGEGIAAREGTAAAGEGTAAAGEGTAAAREGTAAGEGTPAAGEGTAAAEGKAGGEGTAAAGEGTAAAREGTAAAGEGAAAGGSVSVATHRAPSSIRDVGTIAHKADNEQQHLPSPVGATSTALGEREFKASRTSDDLTLFDETGAPSLDEGGASRPEEVEAPGLEQVGTLSYTTLSELERCGYRYYLERILGLAEKRSAARGSSSREGLQARARGTLVHRLLESVDFARPKAPSPEEVARVARELGVRVGPDEREEIAGLVGAVSTSVASESTPAARVAAAKSVRREHPFAFSLGPSEPLVTGVIDLLAREADGGSMVLDYKSDRVGTDEDLDALVERDYGVQRLLYALAVLRGGAPKVEIVHWFLLRPRDWVGARYTAADRGELEERLQGRIQRARARTFIVSKHPHRGLCETCPGRAGLCSWSDAETLREVPPG